MVPRQACQTMTYNKFNPRPYGCLCQKVFGVLYKKGLAW